jgi:Zn-dependent peptidase ImmA (M78 family)/transcriptional regulator with XRE-family HTH domain
MRVEVKPELLRWARERAGLDLAAAAKRCPQLPEWESGDVRPTLKQLEKFARATHAPIGFLFLPEPPPVEQVPIPDFRTLGSRPVERPSPDLLDTLYICQQRQEWYRDFARSEREDPLAFVGSIKLTENVEAAATLIRTALGLDVSARRQMPTWTEALRHFIGQADAAGILVMVSGVVGSNNRRKLDPDEFRGFALSDDLAPLVFINGADSKPAQMFTLAHELAHIWLGQSALSDVGPASSPTNDVEKWCNLVAAELLVPLAALRQEYSRQTVLSEEANRLARLFKVSTLVVLRRIHDAGGLTRDEFWEAYEEELERLRVIRKGGGAGFRLTLSARVSKRFVRALMASTLEGRSSFTEAFRLVGFKKMAAFREMECSVGMD